MIQTRTIGSLTEIYVNGGGYLTQAAPTNFHTFVTSKILTPAESVEDWREVTASERAQLEKADAAFVRPGQELIDRAKALGVTYDEQHGLFPVNGLWLTAEEMEVTILGSVHKDPMWLSQPDGGVPVPQIVTTLGVQSRGGDLPQLYWPNKLQVLRLSASGDMPFDASKNGGQIYAPELHTIADPIIFPNGGRLGMSYGTQKLRNVRIYQIAKDLSLEYCPALSLESFRYLLANAANTDAVSVKVHADVWAKMTDDTVPCPGGDWATYQPNLLAGTSDPIRLYPGGDVAQNYAGGWSAAASEDGHGVIKHGGSDWFGLYVARHKSPITVPMTFSFRARTVSGESGVYFNMGQGVLSTAKINDQWQLVTYRMQKGSMLNNGPSRNGLVEFSRHAITENKATGVMVKDLKLEYGSNGTPTWTPCSDDIEDAELRERTQWRELPIIAASIGISFTH